jgi:uncharacterized protein YhdP
VVAVARRVVSTVAALVVVAALLAGLGWVLTPSVDGADHRVAAQPATHGAPVLAARVRCTSWTAWSSSAR